MMPRNLSIPTLDELAAMEDLPDDLQQARAPPSPPQPFLDPRPPTLPSPLTLSTHPRPPLTLTPYP